MRSVPFIGNELSCRNQRALDGLQYVHVVHERISNQQFLSGVDFLALTYYCTLLSAYVETVRKLKCKKLIRVLSLTIWITNICYYFRTSFLQISTDILFTAPLHCFMMKIWEAKVLEQRRGRTFIEVGVKSWKCHSAQKYNKKWNNFKIGEYFISFNRTVLDRIDATNY